MVDDDKTFISKWTSIEVSFAAIKQHNCTEKIKKIYKKIKLKKPEWLGQMLVPPDPRQAGWE